MYIAFAVSLHLAFIALFNPAVISTIDIVTLVAVVGGGYRMSGERLRRAIVVEAREREWGVA